MSSFCFIIRCVDVSEVEKRLFDIISSKVPVEDIYYVLDSDFEDTENKLSLPRFRNEKGLAIKDPRIGWRCGDYCFYRVYDKKPDYDFYWLIEPDVFIDNISLAKLLAENSINNSDLMIHNFNKPSQKWIWLQRYKDFYPDHEVYGGFFPLVRLSNTAVKNLYKERVRLIAENSIEADQMPNDESFVCSFLGNNGYQCRSIQLTKMGSFNLKSKYVSNVEAGLIHHPVFYSYELFIKKLTPVLQKAIKDGSFCEISYEILKINGFDENVYSMIFDVLIRGNKINKLRDLAIYNENDIDFSLSAFELAKMFRPDGSLLVEKSKKLRGELHKVNSIGLTPVISSIVNEKSIKQASYKDFNLGVRSIVDLVDLDFYKIKPYSYEEGRLYLVDTENSSYDAPFLYSSQRDRALILCDILPKLIQGSIDIENVTFIFSIGRCGSTLLSKIFSAVGKFNVSECDVFSQTSDFSAINASIFLFQYYNRDDNHDVVFKFRSQSNQFVDDYVLNFSGANFVFLYRDKLSWAKSYSGKFKWNRGQLMDSYKSGYQCLEKLKSSNVSLKIIDYDELLNNPKVVTEDSSELNKIKEVMLVDSQEGVINNSDTSYNLEEVSAFLESCNFDIGDLV